jgi:hypothetical protein
MEHGVLDQMTWLVEVSVIIALRESMFSAWNPWTHALWLGLFQNGVAVVARLAKRCSALKPSIRTPACAQSAWRLRFCLSLYEWPG